MKKKYQSSIVKAAKMHIEILESSNFFKDFDIQNMDIVEDELCISLTKKFIDGEPIDKFCFSDEEYSIILNEIIKKDAFTRLKKKGFIESYSDDKTNETFFLTEKGKNYFKKNK